MKHHPSHAAEVKGGEHSHMHHKKMHDHHMAEAKKHVAHMMKAMKGHQKMGSHHHKEK